MTDLKLGILLWSQGASWAEQLDAAQRVDRLGYDHLWTWDHLYAIFGDPYQPIFEGWTLAWRPGRWPRSEPGWACWSGANTFRNPGWWPSRSPRSTTSAVAGRSSGIGGAWIELEHQAHGIDFGIGLRAAARLARRIRRRHARGCSTASR